MMKGMSRDSNGLSYGNEEHSLMSINEEGILQLLMKNRTRVSAAAWVVVRDAHAAEDIFQNVALKALTKNVVFESDGALLSWAFITARREGIDWLRRHRKEVSGLGDEILELLERDWLGENPAQVSERTDALRQCLEGLPETSKKMLRLRYFEGYCCEEVARKLELGLNAIYKRLSRLHVSLRECIECRLEAGGESAR